MYKCSVRVHGNHLIISEYPDNSVHSCGVKGKNDVKLRNNLVRARKYVLGYGFCNDWEWFGTITFDSDKFPDIDFYDDSIRDKFIRDNVRSYFEYLRRKYPSYRYLFVTEFGELTHRLHVHGLFMGLPDDLFIRRLTAKGNIKKYKGRVCYECVPFARRFGEIGDFTRVGHVGKSVSYMTKYLGKSFGQDVSVGSHCFYHSQGLKFADYERKNMRCTDLIHSVDKLGLNGVYVSRNDSYHTANCVVDLSELDNVGLSSLAGILYNSDIDFVYDS